MDNLFFGILQAIQNSKFKIKPCQVFLLPSLCHLNASSVLNSVSHQESKLLTLDFKKQIVKRHALELPLPARIPAVDES